MPNGWYMGANEPGKPRVFLTFIGGLDRYVECCDRIVSERYTWFNFTHATAAVAPEQPQTIPTGAL